MEPQSQLKNISLCIPRISGNITKKNIEDVIKSLNIGEIKNIELLSKKPTASQSEVSSSKGEINSCVFIHFKRWYSTENAIKAHELLTNNKDIKVFYNEPWFWKISIYKPLKK
jgi:hypothetical protein